ncbi:helix-turn-helix domain-containing protein [Franconibacter pulveris 1160]|jgi:predicted transcriptional regulator|uniref:Transcriptional regulator n=2 Tax=Franconibacter TaxID=1649295 RepID=A0A0J8VP51_9ENTR|nr:MULTISPECIES: helix-turn-helix transcriptional regulator [Enterobacteriaceae]KMV34305.1 transcriptional regulator [Franconibacter pulveris]MCK1970307.1 helix-turn-helix transcriptional regulator [Franconibacter sp. IITDAS19]MDT3641365.1 helix-turn-helix transcriptional regulator [Cronobacter sakazakii]
MKTLQDVIAQMPPERRKRVKKMAEESVLEVELQRLRETLAISQQQVAEIMGVTQPAIAALEQRGVDIKLITLKRYIEALGGKLSLKVEMNGETSTFPL